MNSDLLVSVVIPCLNRAGFLRATIDSVLAQNYSNIECLVVDGGSSDGTLDILKSYGNQIRWISEPDKGHADAINKGWKMSNGQILAWLNADDLWQIPDTVSTVVNYFKIHPDTDVLYGDCGEIDEKGNLTGLSYLRKWDLRYAVETCDHCIPQPAAFIRRGVLEKVGWLDTNFYQKKDHELWLRIGLRGKIDYLPVLLAHARTSPGLSHEGKSAAAACLQVTRKVYSWKEIPEEVRIIKRRALSNSYIKGTEYAFLGGKEWRIIARYIFLAILMDPSNSGKAIRTLRGYLNQEMEQRPGRRWKIPILVFAAAGLPGRIFRRIKRIFSVETKGIPNLAGDRDIEYTWITSRINESVGTALDFGSGDSSLGLFAARKGYDVTAVDLQRISWPYEHKGLRFLRGDLLKLPLPKKHFDLIINCSAIEHAGIAGRYGVEEHSENADLEIMGRMKALMKPGGVMLLTIPVGRDQVFIPNCRIYGEERLSRLLKGFQVEEEEYWVKNSENRWVQSNKETALRFQAEASSLDPLKNVYALGCFLLRPNEE